ncbi:MAG TPA: energy transducer TonB [Thermoanaerobaculia bacterium]|nr:energy transducer TonB [Thermoanaerobaculia bacterium]
MRRFFILILLLTSAVAVHAASYEARSPLHAIAFDVVPVSDFDLRFDMTITDVATGHVLAAPHLAVKRGHVPAETQIVLRDLVIRVRVGEMGGRLVANADFQQGESVIDSIQTSWSTGPRTVVVADHDGPLRVGGDVKAPVVVNRVEPLYTDEARRAGISGIVILEVVIDRNGVVTKADVLKPLPFGLDQAAVDAVKQWKFRPGTLNGVPVDVIFNLTMNFNHMSPPQPR